MIVRFDTVVEVDSEVLEDDLISPEDKGRYLLSIYSGEWDLDLVALLFRLGHFKGNEEETFSTAKEAPKSFSKKKVIEFQPVQVFCPSSLNENPSRDNVTRASRAGTSSVTLIRDLLALASKSSYGLQKIRSVNPLPENTYIDNRLNNHKYSIYITPAGARARDTSLNGEVSELGLTKTNQVDVLRAKLQKLKKKPRSDAPPQILAKVHGEFIEYEMSDAIGDFSRWKRTQLRYIRKGIRERPSVSLQDWLDAISWFAKEPFWNSNFFNRGFLCIMNNYAHYLASKKKFAKKSLPANFDVLE